MGSNVCHAAVCARSRGDAAGLAGSMYASTQEWASPSRNVTGFVGGTWNRFGHYYAVREGMPTERSMSAIAVEKNSQ